MIERKISVVIPVYNNAETIEPLAARLTTTLAEAVRDHEVIFINDGS